MATENFPGANLSTFGFDDPNTFTEDVVEPQGEDVIGDEVEEVIEEVGDEAELEVEEGETDDSTEDVGDDFEIQIPIKTFDGKEQELTLKSEQLTELVNRGYHFDGLYATARDLEAKVKQNEQLVNFVTADPVVSVVTTLRARGFTPAQIAQHVMTMFPEAAGAQQTEETFEYNEDDLDPNVRALLAAERKRNEETSQKVQKWETEKSQRETLEHNNKVFDTAITNLGVDFDETPDSYRRLQQVMSELYPNLDIRTARLTERQAAAVISQAGFRQRNKANVAKQKAAQLTKAKKAPRIVSGVKPTSSQPKGTAPRRNGATGDDRLANLHKLGLG